VVNPDGSVLHAPEGYTEAAESALLCGCSTWKDKARLLRASQSQVCAYAELCELVFLLLPMVMMGQNTEILCELFLC